MKAGDSVWTPAGYAKVTWAGEVKRTDQIVSIELADGRVLECTPEHKIATKRGFVRADALRYTDTVLSGNEWQSNLIGLLSKATHIGFRAIITAAIDGVKTLPQISTERYGKAPTGKFRRVLKSITETVIPSTTPWVILNASTCQSIDASTHWHYEPLAFSPTHPSSVDRKHQSGIPVRTVLNGTGSTPGINGKPESGLTLLANSAVRFLLRLFPSGRSGAISTVRWKTCTSGVASLKSVHDLTVENHACYQANGFLVSNSDSFRYMSLAWREIAPDKPKPPPRDSWDAAFNRDDGELRDWRVA